MGANTVKIPVELEMRQLQAQIGTLRASLGQIKTETAAYRQLNDALKALEKQFNSLQVESKKAFSTQSEIRHFEKNLEKLGSLAQVFQERFAEIDTSNLKLDTKAFDEAVKKVETLKEQLANINKVGDVFKGTDIEKLAKEFDISFDKNITFDKLADKFNKVSDKIQTEINAINKAFKGLGKKEENEVEEAIQQAYSKAWSEPKMLTDQRNQAAARIREKYGLTQKQTDIGKSNKEEWIAAEVSAIKTNYPIKLNAELDKTKKAIKQTEDALEKLQNGKNVNLQSFGVKDQQGLTDLLETQKERLRKIQTEVENISTEAIESFVKEQAAQITEEINFVKDVFQQVLEKLVGGKIFTDSEMAKGANETGEAFQQRLLNTYKSRIEERNTLNDQKTNLNQASQDIKTAGSTATNQTSSLNQELAEAQQAALREEQALNQVAQGMKESAGAAANFEGALDPLSRTIDGCKEELLQLDRTTETINSIKNVITNFMGFNQVLSIARQKVQEAAQHIRTLDKVMTEIAVVTDFNQNDLWGQIDTYSAIAQEYGVAIEGVYEVSALYYQMGLDTEEVMERNIETLKMAKIASLDYATAADYMTVAMNGFKMEADEASRVTDVYSKIAAITASDTKELATAMSKTAASAESVGISFEGAASMIAVMEEATRESSTNINRNLTFLLECAIIKVKKKKLRGVIAA